MILNTGSRTDIPACYSQWFYNRVEEGFLLARNPYNPLRVTRYELDPQTVDILTFCTKNPAPMLPGLSKLQGFRQVWYVTITPYGKDTEPFVPDKREVIGAFKELSRRVGVSAVLWRYDPIFINESYPLACHLEQFGRMAAELEGYTRGCVISFIDLYAKTKRNFPGVREVTREERLYLGQNLVRMAARHGIRIYTCCEGRELEAYGADCGGCMTKEVLERASGVRLSVPGRKKPAREGCGCLLGDDIGEYNTCLNGCLYCYANYDRETVMKNRRAHDPASPYLIGRGTPEDVVVRARQETWADLQLSFFL